jgi:hypothetical protein
MRYPLHLLGFQGRTGWRPPSAVSAFILAQQEEIQGLHVQLTAMAKELASLRKRIIRTLPNSSKPPFQQWSWV